MLRLSLAGPAGPTASTDLVDRLRSFGGVAVLPLYSAASTGDVAGKRTGPDSGPGPGGPPPIIVGCASLTAFSALGRCGPGVTAAEVADVFLYTDNLAALNKDLPLVTADSPAYPGDLGELHPGTLLVSVDSSATLERVRTFLAVSYPNLTAGSGFAPQTFGEVAQVRAALYREVGTVVLLIVGMTLLVAGCSLAIAMGGAVVERKRPFTLLRVSGTPARVLRRVVLLEAMVPLLSAIVIAALAGLATSMPVNSILSPTAEPFALHLPNGAYYLTMAAGLLVCLALIGLTLPLLGRTTVTANARFE